MGDEDEVAGYRRALDAGDLTAAVPLAVLLRELGDAAGAERVARDAAAAGEPSAAALLVCWDWEARLDPALEPRLRDAAESYPPARADLAELLRSTGRSGEARRVLETGAKLGERESWLPLGNLYADDLGDPGAAEQAYRSGIAARDTFCHQNLGLLLLARGDRNAALEEFRLGAAAGDELAARTLRDLVSGPDGDG